MNVTINQVQEDQSKDLLETFQKVQEKNVVERILQKYDDIVSKGPQDVRNCHTVRYVIRLHNTQPYQCKRKKRKPREHK